MGVQGFFSYLCEKCPSIVVPCIEKKPKYVNGIKVLADMTKKNPNGFEVTNLYIDMNGVIHLCCHPDDKPDPKNEEEMMIAIFELLDRIIYIVRPRRLLYLSVDGVAPKAKMIQQRSRRFRTHKETLEKQNLISIKREELISKGAQLPPEKAEEENFDSNCISPGTSFMARLEKSLHYYIHARLNCEPGWKDLQVIFSGSNKPGEGEHKIMDFIRRQRDNPDNDVNARHCVYGADADLIILGLTTHDPNFIIIREAFRRNKAKAKPCEICAQFGHHFKDCTAAAKGELKEDPLQKEVKYIFVKLNKLRDHLAEVLKVEKHPFAFDLERIIDDWVFMCIFVGNDFLPALPFLEIRDGTFDRFVELYKSALYKEEVFLTDNCTVNMSLLQLIMTDFGKVEEEMFRRRQENEIEFSERQEDRKKRMKGEFASTAGTSDEKRNQEEASNSDDEPEDDTRICFKDIYYKLKFNVDKGDYDFRYKLVTSYVEGLNWVLTYYFQGCPSWQWCFPYYYAPLAADFTIIGDLKPNFEKGKPFAPLEQLMSILPAGSKRHLPEAWGELMCHPESQIISFYPTDFITDLKSKKAPWQGIVLLPFIEDNKLLEALQNVYDKLTADEKKRNAESHNMLYVGIHHQGYEFLSALYNRAKDLENPKFKLNADLFYGMSGAVILSEDVIYRHQIVSSPLSALPDVPDNATVCINYIEP